MNHKQKLEFTRIGKENRPQFEPRLEDPARSHHAAHRVSDKNAKQVLSRCEWGYADDSLPVENLPMAEPETVAPLTPTFSREGRGGKAGQTGVTPDWFGDGGAHSG